MYIGTVLNLKRHGLGVLRLENGAIYKGSFANDLFNGNGSYEFAYPFNGCKYVGQFKDGKKEGTGTLQQKNFSYKGHFKND